MPKVSEEQIMNVVLDAGADAWQQLTPELLRSVCACPYLPHEIEA